MAGDPQMPQGWTWRIIDDLGRVLTGKTPSTKIASYFGGHIPFITPSDMGASLEIEYGT
jgi:type I restriction enzyme S subunit